MLEKDLVTALALESGLTLRILEDGTTGLKSYVYDFAELICTFVETPSRDSEFRFSKLNRATIFNLAIKAGFKRRPVGNSIGLHSYVYEFAGRIQHALTPNKHWPYKFKYSEGSLKFVSRGDKELSDQLGIDTHVALYEYTELGRLPKMLYVWMDTHVAPEKAYLQTQEDGRIFIFAPNATDANRGVSND